MNQYLFRACPHFRVNEQQPDQQHHRIPSGTAGVTGGIADQFLQPGSADDLAARVGNDAFCTDQHAEEAASNGFLLGQQQGKDQQDRAKDHDQIQNVLPVQMHIICHLANGLYVLLARLE